VSTTPDAWTIALKTDSTYDWKNAEWKRAEQFHGLETGKAQRAAGDSRTNFRAWLG